MVAFLFALHDTRKHHQIEVEEPVRPAASLQAWQRGHVPTNGQPISAHEEASYNNYPIEPGTPLLAMGKTKYLQRIWMLVGGFGDDSPSTVSNSGVR